ncbi:unnamed protein product [Brugia timori]|uniref:NADH dehydrogenase subunit 3 n=1 Tax=Brugia timori TaxID=42155 RepID=A0A0R3Q7U9_9BILA|nr:unnamed protein product [Brugia timori]
MIFAFSIFILILPFFLISLGNDSFAYPSPSESTIQ